MNTVYTVRQTKLIPVTAFLLWSVQLCSGACIPENSPQQGNQDALARLLAAQDKCPGTAVDFRNLVERAGARLETTDVNFVSFHNPEPGAFFLFEIVSGKLTGLNLSVERGDLLFGHFLARNGLRLVLNSSGLLLEAIAWDPARKLFNFYELIAAGPQRPRWFYRGDSKLILEDIALLYRRRDDGQKPFGEQLRCSGCHVNGGLIQKELTAPHNDWWMKSRPLPLGSLKLDSTVAKIFKGLVDADELAKLVETTSRRLFASAEYRKVLRSRTMQEQLRPLFCPVELNIESDRDSFDQKEPLVRVPAGFFADPRLGVAQILIPRNHYDRALEQSKSQMPGLVPVRADADHAWLTPVKANSDILLTEALVEMGVVDQEFVADVLAVDFTNPLFSPSRCSLLKLVPAEGSPGFRAQFQAALSASPEPAAKVLLENLTDPQRDAAFHRRQVSEYLEACEKRSSAPEAAMEWFGLLAQRRAEIDRLELSRHSQGRILESPGRVVFPSASAPRGRLAFTSACEVRPPG